MFSPRDCSNHEGRKRQGDGFICGLLVRVLLMGGAVFLGVLFPGKLLAAGEGYPLTWLPALSTPPKKPLLKPPREAARAFVPNLPIPETPKLLVPFVADLELRKIPHTISSARITEPPWPIPPTAPQSPTPKRQVWVHIGLFGDAAETFAKNHAVDQVQTGEFGSLLSLPGGAQGESPSDRQKLGFFGLPTGPDVGNEIGEHTGNPGVAPGAGFGSGVARGGHGNGGASGSQVASAAFRRHTKSRQPRWKIFLRRRARSSSPSKGPSSL